MNDKTKSLRSWFAIMMNLYLNSGGTKDDYIGRLEAAHDTLVGVGRIDVWQQFKDEYSETMYGDKAQAVFAKIERRGF